jgi:flagellar basal-body rod modification protein FlgD
MVYGKIKGGFKMSISALASNILNSSTSSTSTASSAVASLSSLSANDFLTLLLTELKNQDPSSPMDSSAMLQQFASLTQVQLAQATNTALQSLSQATATGYIGKTIAYSGSSSNTIAVASGTAGVSTYTLAGNAANVTATITDANGKIVKTANLGSMSAGSYSYQWDGTNNSGTKVADGTYTVGFSAKDGSGNSVSVSTQGTATVTAVVFNSGVAYLVTDAGEIPLTSVTGITS